MGATVVHPPWGCVHLILVADHTKGRPAPRSGIDTHSIARAALKMVRIRLCMEDRVSLVHCRGIAFGSRFSVFRMFAHRTMSFDLAPVAYETTCKRKFGQEEVWPRDIARLGDLHQSVRGITYGHATSHRHCDHLESTCAYCGSWNVVVVLETGAPVQPWL